MKFKLLWLYLLDKCDHAGIFKKNIRLAEFLIGESLPESEIDKHFNGRLIKLDSETWRIPKFIEFQYGVLNPNNRMHLSVIALLDKEGASKGLARGLLAPKDKDKNKDKNKDKVSITRPKQEEVSAYFQELGKNGEALKFFDYYSSKGWLVGKSPMKDWKAAARNWLRSPYQKKETGFTKPQQRNIEKIVSFHERNKNEKRNYDQGSIAFDPSVSGS
jgi:hypothetical protein